MNQLQQACVWLRRLRHCRGFGIQSPTDYQFVRYVVNEHWPYYAYASLGKDDGRQRRKLGRLYFRLANHLQPDSVTDLVGVGTYVKAGCRKAQIANHVQEAAKLIIAPADADLPPLLDACSQQTVLVVEDIGHHQQVWRSLLADSRPTVTFDLYYCGILFFHPQRYKQNYIVNF